ncbi:HU family DNA-binding protein [bacterium]|nr:HU family DNA-binding protein [bacterium]
MNKDRLSEVLARRCDLSKGDARVILDNMLEIISEELIKDNDVLLVGFGRFSLRKRAARRGRNPKTGTDLQLPETVSIGFTPSKSLKVALQGPNRK